MGFWSSWFHALRNGTFIRKTAYNKVMKETDWRKTLEVIVKGLVAVVVGLAGLYILGWVLSLLGGILLGFAGIIVALLRWLVPVAILVGVVYFAVTQLQSRTVSASSKPAPVDLEAVQKPVQIPVVEAMQVPVVEPVQVPVVEAEEIAAEVIKTPLEIAQTAPDEHKQTLASELEGNSKKKKPSDEKEA